MLLMSIDQYEEKIQEYRRKITSFVSIAFARREILFGEKQLFIHINVVNIYLRKSKKIDG